MAEVRIMYWKEIPYGVRAKDSDGQVTRQLPELFQEAVDAAAMVDGHTDQAAYQAGFKWGPAENREGAAAEVADAVAAEIVTAYPEDRLLEMAKNRNQPGDPS
ncbi:MAG: virulence factor [Acidobacteriota bacterium]